MLLFLNHRCMHGGLLMLVELLTLWSLFGMRGGDTILSLILIMNLVMTHNGYCVSSVFFCIGAGVPISTWKYKILPCMVVILPSLTSVTSLYFEQFYKIIMAFFSSWLAAIWNEERKFYLVVHTMLKCTGLKCMDKKYIADGFRLMHFYTLSYTRLSADLHNF